MPHTIGILGSEQRRMALDSARRHQSATAWTFHGKAVTAETLCHLPCGAERLLTYAEVKFEYSPEIVDQINGRSSSISHMGIQYARRCRVCSPATSDEPLTSPALPEIGQQAQRGNCWIMTGEMTRCARNRSMSAVEYCHLGTATVLEEARSVR